MNKTYSEMTPEERLADRIAKNKEIDRRVSETKALPKKSAAGSKQKSGSNVLDDFQQIKRTQGIDAASDFVLDRKKQG